VNLLWLCQNVAREKIGLQSEGIVNINPDIRSRAAEYGIDIEEYKTFYPINPPYSRAETISAGIWYGQEQWIEYLGVSFHIVTEMAQQHNVALNVMNEWGDVESIRAFSQWHARGIVQAFPYERLGPVTGAWYSEESLSKAEESWAKGHREAQGFATDYYYEIRSIMWDALNVWAQ
jgi:hypothetical protein